MPVERTRGSRQTALNAAALQAIRRKLPPASRHPDRKLGAVS